jgi:hypothetical protein
MKPPRWSEMLLRSLLIDRDRDTISGDLLEEYREVAVPTYGASGARWWYRRQVAGFVWRAMRLPLMIGLAIGAALGVMNLVDTARQPLADDDAGTMLAWLVALLAMWSATAVAVTWHTRRVADAVKVGAILGVVTIAVFHAAAIVRVNVFLDAIRYRGDWQNLVARYNQSGFSSLRAYANYEYAAMTPMVITLGAIAGSISGVVGGLLNTVRRTPRER